MAGRLICILIVLISLLAHFGFAKVDHFQDLEVGHPDNSNPDAIFPVNYTEIIDHVHASNLHQRWFSTPELPVVQPGPYPWPKVCDSSPDHWLRYCFLDDDTAEILTPIMMTAIARYGPALTSTSLQIQPDPACEGIYFCVCNHVSIEGLGAQTDSLRIWNGMVDEHWQNRISGTFTTIGYQYYSQVPWRHYMNFGYYHPEDPTSNDFNQAVLTMMHELGHAAGLLHEHQRSNAENFITINWHNLGSYPAAVRNVNAETDTRIFPPDMSTEDRIDKVVKDPELISKYWPVAGEYYSSAYWPQVSASFYKQAPANQFDTESIMIYGSNAGSSGNPEIELKEPGPNGNTLIFQGGNPDPGQATLSSGDVERLEQLYPLNGAASGSGTGSKYKRGSNDSMPKYNATFKPYPVGPLQVVIPGEPHVPQGLNITVYPPRYYGPKDIAKAKYYPRVDESGGPPPWQLVFGSGNGKGGDNGSNQGGKDGDNGSGDASSSATGAESTST